MTGQARRLALTLRVNIVVLGLGPSVCVEPCRVYPLQQRWVTPEEIDEATKKSIAYRPPGK